MLVVYPLPDKGIEIAMRRGSGLFITVRRLAMPVRDNQNVSYAFRLSKIAKMRGHMRL